MMHGNEVLPVNHTTHLTHSALCNPHKLAISLSVMLNVKRTTSPKGAKDWTRQSSVQYKFHMNVDYRLFTKHHKLVYNGGFPKVEVLYCRQNHCRINQDSIKVEVI